jgi:hypothetical protein
MPPNPAQAADGGGDQATTVEAVDQWLTANAGRFDFRALPNCSP